MLPVRPVGAQLAGQQQGAVEVGAGRRARAQPEPVVQEEHRRDRGGIGNADHAVDDPGTNDGSTRGRPMPSMRDPGVCATSRA